MTTKLFFNQGKSVINSNTSENSHAKISPRDEQNEKKKFLTFDSLWVWIEKKIL